MAAQEASETQETQQTSSPEEILFRWTGPSRPFKRRDRDFYVTLIAMAALLGVILFIVDGVLPVILIASLVFLFFVLSTVEPDKLDYSITPYGVQFGSSLIEWEVSRAFYFTKRIGIDVVVIETSQFPGRMEIVVPAENKETIREILSRYLVEGEDKEGITDRLVRSLSRFFPK